MCLYDLAFKGCFGYMEVVVVTFLEAVEMTSWWGWLSPPETLVHVTSQPYSTMSLVTYVVLWVIRQLVLRTEANRSQWLRLLGAMNVKQARQHIDTANSGCCVSPSLIVEIVLIKLPLLGLGFRTLTGPAPPVGSTMIVMNFHSVLSGEGDFLMFLCSSSSCDTF